MNELALLPDELLLHIIEALCTTRPSTYCTPDEHRNGPDCISLSILSKTCRKLHAVVQPILFRSVWSFHPGRLVRTLLEKPQLAALVQDLSIDDSLEKDISSEDAALFTTAIGKICPAEMDEVRAKLAFKTANCTSRGWGEFEIDNFILKAIATLAVSQCCNANKIMIFTTDTCWDLLNTEDHPLAQKLLDIKLCYSLDRGQVFINDNFASLVAYAPRLKRLTCSSIEDISDRLWSDTITELSISCSHLSYEGCASMVKNFPNLEKFIYNPMYHDDDREISPRLLSELLAQQCKKLRHLTLIWEREEMDDDDVEAEEEDKICSLASLTALEEVALGNDYHTLTNSVRSPESPYDEFFPASIKRITFIDEIGALSLESLSNVALRELPALKVVTIIGQVEGAKQESLKLIFQRNNISLHILSYDERFSLPSDM